MTVEVAQRRTRKPKVRPSSETLAIGEIDQTVFACPACARPLALGARSCPGCGTRLILGVQAQRASIFVSVGLVAGIIVSGLFVVISSAIAGAAALSAAATVAPSAQPSASAAPSSTPVAATATTGTGTNSSVPALSRSALAQAVAVDERLETSGAGLAAALAAPKFDAFAVSQFLRATSAEAVIGLQLSAYIGAWSGGKALSGELTSFYTTVQQTAADGLSASIRNEKAYRTAGEKMVDLLAGLDDVDGHVRNVADRAGVTVAPAGDAAP
jgi:hypothetical protein